MFAPRLAVLLATLLADALLAALAGALLLLLLAGLLVRIAALLLLTRLLVRGVLIVLRHLISFQGVYLERFLRGARPQDNAGVTHFVPHRFPRQSRMELAAAIRVPFPAKQGLERTWDAIFCCGFSAFRCRSWR
jgi:hypothetical protein